MSEKMGGLNLAVPHWARHEHPIFWLESRRQGRIRGLATIQGAFLPVLFGVVGLTIPLMMVFVIPSLYGYSDLESNIALLLTLEIVALVCIQLGAGAIVNILMVALAAPLISGEMELQSWRLLRTTMVTLPDIIFAKLAAVLHELRTMLLGLFVLRLASTGTAVLLFAHVMLRETVFYMGGSEIRSFLARGEWIPYVILIAAITFYNLGQPFVQAMMNGMLGMAASSYARSRSQAIAGGLVGRLVAWVGTTLLNVGLIFGLSYLFSNWFSPSYAPLAIFHNMPTPTGQQIASAICLTISGYLLGYLLAQIGFISVLVGVVLRRTRRLGV
jgi:hypothetical protein